MKIKIVAFISLVFFVLNVSAQSFSDSLMFTLQMVVFIQKLMSTGYKISIWIL